MRERRRLAAAYRDALAAVPGLVLPADPPYGTTNYQSFVVRLEDDVPVDRDALMQQLLDRGISSAPGHHGRAPGARLRRPPGAAAARHRAAHPALADPAAVPRHDGRAGRAGGRARSTRLARRRRRGR